MRPSESTEFVDLDWLALVVDESPTRVLTRVGRFFVFIGSGWSLEDSL